ncbi:MAG: M15 family metallopeptidase [Bacilli bacterium]|nr:M15 family metallopeptidase [Bacilli bacterium]
MKRRRIKKSVVRLFFLILGIIILIVVVCRVISIAKYHKTDEYKLLKIGYSDTEIALILDNQSVTEYALNHEYDEFIDDFIKEKYYLNDNLERYLNYKKDSNKSFRDVVSIVNVNADNDWYTDTKKADLSKKELILVNKFNYLDEDYSIQDIKEISPMYAYSENESNDEIMSFYKKMFNAASKENIDLIISSAFRSYDEQEKTYNEYKNFKGEEYANKYAAKAGYSEHQTGLAFDILTTGANTDNFENTKEFSWLRDNAYKYGFIMRYPKDKEYLTGYEYEPWHYRYVGVDVASKIYKEDLTFDEYYAYYIVGEK